MEKNISSTKETDKSVIPISLSKLYDIKNSLLKKRNGRKTSSEKHYHYKSIKSETLQYS